MVDPSGALSPPLFRDRAPRFGRFARLVASGWWLVASFTTVAGVLAVLALRAVPAEHTASMVVGPIARGGASAMGVRAPVSTRANSPLSVLEFGGGDEVLSDFTRFIELLTSPPVAARLMAEPEVLHHLFPERWDAATGRWRAPGGLLGRLRGLVLALAGHEDWIEPDAETLSRQLRRIVVVQSLGTNPMRRILYRDGDRAFAIRLLERMTAAADAHLRAEASNRAAAQIAHIRRRIEETPGNDDRRALTDLLADQERVAMMIAVDLPFAADPIEPPGAPNHPDWPNPLIILPLALATGAALGLFLVFARSAWAAAPGARSR